MHLGAGHFDTFAHADGCRSQFMDVQTVSRSYKPQDKDNIIVLNKGAEQILQKYTHDAKYYISAHSDSVQIPPNLLLTNLHAK